MAIQIACHITRPIRSCCPAPSYCATNVFAYAQIPSGNARIANHAIDAVNDASIASPDTQLSSIRSANVMTVHDKLDTTSGAATRSTSRPPLGRPHQVRSSIRTSTFKRHADSCSPTPKSSWSR